MKKVFLVFLSAVVILTTLLTGCSSKPKPAEETKDPADQAIGYGLNATGMPIVKEPVTLTVLFDRTADHGDFEKMWFMNHIKEKTGIYLKFNLVEASGWEEKKSLAFASGDYPDVFMHGITKQDENVYGPQGILVNLAPYIKKYAPKAMEMYAKYPEIIKEIKFDNGNIYVMPSINDSPRDNISYSNYIQKAWLDKLGMKEPKTLNELFEVLKAFKTGDPNGNGKADEIPMSGRYKSNLNLSILTAVGFVAPLHDVINDKYIYVPAQPGYQEYLKYMNKLYSGGLLDKDYFSQSDEQLMAKASSGIVGVLNPTPYSVLPKEPDYNQYESLNPLTSDVNSKAMWPANSACNRSWGIFAMTDKCKYPEAAVRLIDYFYTTEGSRAVRCGPEYGKWSGTGGYQILEENSEHVKAKLYMDDFTGFWAWRLAKAGPTNLPFNSNDLINDIIVGADVKNSWLTKQIFDSGCREVRRFGYPAVSFTEEEQRQIATFVDLDSYVEGMTAKFVTGQANFSDWDSYIAELKRLGMDKMAAVRQAAYDRYKAKSSTIN